MGNLSARIKEGFSNFKDTVDTKAIEAARGMPGKIAAVGLKGGKVALDGYSMVTGNDTDVASAALSGASSHDHHFKWWFEYAPIRGEYLHA